MNWAYAIETVADPDEEQNVDLLVEKMMNFLLNGLSPVAQAPEVPAEYSEKL